MADYQVCWKESTKTATIQSKGDMIPSGATKLGTFIHSHASDPEGADVSHVFYHHVQDLLYKGADVLNMQDLTIAHDTTYVPLVGISSSPATKTLAVAGTQQITNTFDPVGASNQVVTYTTSAASKATVSASGLITAVASGSATITVTAQDGGFTDTVVVTVS